MKFYEDYPPRTDKPIMIVAMPDMGNVAGIVIDFVNRAVKAKIFRKMVTTYPSYVTDQKGVINLPNEEWLYRYADGLMTFGGGSGQPRDSSELHAACRDVVEVARRFSARLLYTVGGYHTRIPQDPPRAVVTATTEELADQLKRSGFAASPRNSVIQGFNGIMLGYAKVAGIRGIGIFGELDEPSLPQYQAAKSVIKTLERLTYRSFGDVSEMGALGGRGE